MIDLTGISNNSNYIGISQSPFIIAISDFIPIIDEENNNSESTLNDLNNYLEIETFKELFDNNLAKIINDFRITDEILNIRYSNDNAIKNIFDNKKKNFEEELKNDIDIIEYLKKIILEKNYIEFLYKNLLDLSSNSLKITIDEIQNIISKYDNIFLAKPDTPSGFTSGVATIIENKKLLFDQKQLIKYSEIDIDNLFFDQEINLGFIRNDDNLFNNIKSILLSKLFDELKKNIFTHQSNKQNKIIENKFNNISDDRINLNITQNNLISATILDFFNQNFSNAEDYNFSSNNQILSNTYVLLKNKNAITSTNTVDKIIYSYIKIFIKELNFSNLKRKTQKIDNKINVDINMFNNVFGNYINNFFTSGFNETGYLNDLVYFKNNDNSIILNLEFNYIAGNFNPNSASRKFISGKDEYLESIEFSSGVDTQLDTIVISEKNKIKPVVPKVSDLISPSIPNGSTTATDIIKENLPSIIKQKLIIDESINITTDPIITANSTININQKVQEIIANDQNLAPIIQEIINSTNFSNILKQTITNTNIDVNLVNQNLQGSNVTGNSNLGGQNFNTNLIGS